MNAVVLSLFIWVYSVHSLQIDVNVKSPNGPYPISPNFASFSIEVYQKLPDKTISGFGDYLARVTNVPKPAYINLLKFLSQQAGTTRGPQIRIGGSSVDTVMFGAKSDVAKPNNVLHILTPDQLRQTKAVLVGANSKLVFGVNFMNGDDPKYAVQEVKALAEHIGWEHIDAIEIGNECDFYTAINKRPKGYNPTVYMQQMEKYMKDILAIPGVPPKIIQAGTFCCQIEYFYDNVIAWMVSHAKNFKSVSIHNYPLHRNEATIEKLLSDESAKGGAGYNGRLAALYPKFANAVNSKGIEFVLGEANSISGGGKVGVGNTFAAALWSIDYMFYMASIGFRHVNFHGGMIPGYTPIDFPGSGEPRVKALYYGMWFFARAAGRNCRLVKADQKPASGEPRLDVWACVDDKGTLSVVVVHKDLGNRKSVKVQVKVDGYSSGQLLRLTAPSEKSENEIQFAGQTWDGATAEGKVLGKFSPVNVAASKGVFSFDVAPISAVLLSVPKGTHAAIGEGDAVDQSSSEASPAKFQPWLIVGIVAGALLVVVVVVVAVVLVRRRASAENTYRIM